jgi:hypothetical protein
MICAIFSFVLHVSNIHVKKQKVLFKRRFLCFEMSQYGCHNIQNFMLDSDLKELSEKVKRKKGNLEKRFSQKIPSPEEKCFLGQTIF